MKNAIILGSGRSGTSMIAGIIHSAGYFMGEDLYPANISNPKGFFENNTINYINEKILSNYQKYDIFNVDRFQRWLIIIDKEINIKCTDSTILNQIKNETAKEPFCYKDPRFSYTLPVWKQYLPENTIFLCIFRKPQDTVYSIIKECATADYLEDFYINEEYAYSIWEHVYCRILNYSKEIQNNTIYIHYNQIIDGTVIKILSKSLGVEIDNSFSDKVLNRTKINNEYVPETCVELYNELCKRAGYSDRLTKKSYAANEEIEILHNRIKNKELLLEKKSKMLRQKILTIKLLEDRIQNIYASWSWKIGRLIIKLIKIPQYLLLRKKLNEIKDITYNRNDN